MMTRARAVASDYDEKKANITAHASVLYATEGFSRVSMTQLAEACDISKSNLYHYYRNKNEILFNLLDEHMDDILAHLRHSTQLNSHKEYQLDYLVHTLLMVYQGADYKHRILLNDLQVLPREMQEIIRGKERLIVQYFKHAILLEFPNFSSRPYMVSAAAMTLLGSINWAFTWFKGNKELSVADYAKFIVDTYRNGLEHYE